MYCRSRDLIEETPQRKKFNTNFLYENLDTTTITNYNVIYNHFTNFKIDREYNIFLTDQGNHSLSYLKFRLCDTNEEENWINLLVLTIETNSILEPTYEYHFREDIESFYNFLADNPNLENFLIEIEMETIFYLHLNNEDGTYGEKTVTVENIFKDDVCSVCMENKPNILFLPCIHLIVCEECENKGKFKDCVKCRKNIFRKIKIENKKFFSDKIVGDDEKTYADKGVGDDDKQKPKAKLYLLCTLKSGDERKKLEIKNLKDAIKEKTGVVEFLEKNLEKEKKELLNLEYDLEEIY